MYTCRVIFKTPIEALNFFKALSRLFKFDLDTCTMKPAGLPSLLAACLVAVDISPTISSLFGLSQAGVYRDRYYTLNDSYQLKPW